MVLHVHLTAFGPFGGVPVNPTALLIKRLPSFIAQRVDRLPPNVVIDDLTEMETSAFGAQQILTQLHANTTQPLPPSHPSPPPSPSSTPSSPLPPAPTPTPTRHLWLHMGVHPRSSHLLLESCAYNEMDFRIPDQRSYQPRHLPIIPSAPFRRCTRIDLPLLHQRLSPTHPCRLSSDAGRFLCNYSYFLSLQRCSEKRGQQQRRDGGARVAKGPRGAEEGGGGGAGEGGGGGCEWEEAMFVHVPPFERVEEEAQLEFLLDLLLVLSRLEDEGIRWVREEEDDVEGGTEVGAVDQMGLGNVTDQIDVALHPHVQQVLMEVRPGKGAMIHDRPPLG